MIVARAMRVGGTLYYLLKDHLGSASVITDASGNIVGETRFFPYPLRGLRSKTRFTTGTMHTDQLYTGQRELAVHSLIPRDDQYLNFAGPFTDTI